MSTRNLTTNALCNFALVALATQTLASPTKIVHNNTPQCDFLFIPDDVEELGEFSVFPADEALSAADLGHTPVIPCPSTNLSNLPEIVVDIRNLSGRAWSEVWYVADPETTVTNFDGEANQVPFSPLQEAFRIDNDISDPGGTHHPLISESLFPNGIWDIGESWQFVLQDYSNSLGLSAAAINSIGVGNASVPLAGVTDSSGSIIAITEVVPEPASLALALVGMGALVATRRSRSLLN